MNKPLTRRLFMKAMSALPVAVRGTSETFMEPTSLTSVGMDLQPVAGYSTFCNQALLGLANAGALPGWAKRDMIQEAAVRSYRLPPDIAALRSVSVAGKCAINRRRQEAQIMKDAATIVADRIARQLFYENNPGGIL